MVSGAGVYAFAFTDIEGSTALLARLGEEYAATLEQHRSLIRLAAEQNGGKLVGTAGDSTLTMYADPKAAVTACVQAQRSLLAHAWDHEGGVRVRMGVHVGPATMVDGEPIGITIHHAARVMSAAHGGQLVVTDAMRPFLENIELADLGEVALKDVPGSMRLHQVKAPGLPERFPPLRAERIEPGNLPRPVTTFVGRDAETTALVELVRHSPAVTITGPGGAGKTRLALRVATRLATDLPYGAWFVDLAPVVDPQFVPTVVAAALGMVSGGATDTEQAVLTLLRRQRTLLLLDNAEHLIDAVAGFADAILDNCPEVRLLVTSRQPLGLAGEQVWPLDVLPPDAAAELFEERARLVSPTFAGHPKLPQLCRHLDHLPLAIELVAARVRAYDVAELVHRVGTVRSAFTATSRVPERQRTLQATIDWSVRLLSADERQLLAVLSVFPSEFSLQAAEAVAPRTGRAATALLLETLVLKSLVVNRSDGGMRRFRLLDIVRSYAGDLLGEHGEIAQARSRHLDWVIEWARGLRPDLEGPDPAPAVLELRRGEDDLRVAFDWATATGDDADLLALVAATGPLGLRQVGVIAETADWIDVALAVHPTGSDAERLDVLTLATQSWLHPTARLARFAEEALELARRLDRPCAVALALDTQAWLVADEDEDLALVKLGQAFELVADRTMAVFAASIGNGLANLLRRMGRFDDAFGILDRVDDLAPEGLGLFAAWIPYQRGHLHRASGDLEQAQHWFERAVVSAHDTASLAGLDYAEFGLGELARRRGDWAEAAEHFRTAYDAELRIGGAEGAHTLSRLVEAELHLGHLDRSAQLLAEAESTARKEGRVLGWAFYHHAAGQVRRAQGRRDDAQAHFEQVVEMAPVVHWSDGLHEALSSLADMAVEDGDESGAARYRDRAAEVPPR
jgi:predicted ATPase/tetratricopeptide (TPR) repeat protein